MTQILQEKHELIKNSRQFVEIFRNLKLFPEHYFRSFGVESLFSNMPIQQVMDIIEKKLRDVKELQEKTQLSVNALMALLGFCLLHYYFTSK